MAGIRVIANLECSAESKCGEQRVAQHFTPANALVLQRALRSRQVLKQTLSSAHGAARRPLQSLWCLLSRLHTWVASLSGMATESVLTA